VKYLSLIKIPFFKKIKKDILRQLKFLTFVLSVSIVSKEGLEEGVVWEAK
jgi:hypothetical protein